VGWHGRSLESGVPEAASCLDLPANSTISSGSLASDSSSVHADVSLAIGALVSLATVTLGGGIVVGDLSLDLAVLTPTVSLVSAILPAQEPTDFPAAEQVEQVDAAVAAAAQKAAAAADQDGGRDHRRQREGSELDGDRQVGPAPAGVEVGTGRPDGGRAAVVVVVGARGLKDRKRHFKLLD